jgi:para-aminobenzoate synthetase component 1
MNNPLPQIPPACCHLLEELPLQLPFWRYYEIYRDTPYAFLLDSAKESDWLGRYSFIGGDPSLVYRAKRIKRDKGQPPSGCREHSERLKTENGNGVGIQGSGFRVQHSPSITSLQPTAYSLQSDEKAVIEVIELVNATGQCLEKPLVTRRTAFPFEDLRRLLAAYRVDYGEYVDHPVPLLSGAVGYFGYEAGYFIEELPDCGVDDLTLPDIYLMFVSTILAHCHGTGRSYLSIIGRGEDETAARRQAEILRESMLAQLAVFDPITEASRTDFQSGRDELQIRPPAIEIRGQCDQAEYCRKIETVKEHISAGDVYQACLTRRLDAPLIGGKAWDLYGQLRRINPAPFAAFLNFPEVQIVSSSPERFLALGPDGIAESRPIKGTRPRGATAEEDQRLRDELSVSLKDRAENLMIVDLVRNDFGRVCAFRTVEVPEFMLIEEYATVFQMVSTIRGKLTAGRDGLDLIRACFPGGSMTGAPKIEAMKIIDRLEPVKRGIYSGAIGYLDFAGPMDLSIVIRTIVITGGRCYFHVGGGIVADSEPMAEFRETQDKARALIQALTNLQASAKSTP